MKYTIMTEPDRAALLGRLAGMPGYLETTFEGLTAAAAATPGPGNAFSPVEQCWHLADLERIGFATRIRRLLTEDNPSLPEFDGERIAKERDYKSLSLEAGLDAFRKARAENLAALQRITVAQWARTGTQEGAGRVALCDVPTMMAEHDASHRREIDAWGRSINERPPAA
ncbi:MAG TPA: DinB family protein [Candidatus Polarisedimenticolia bacterium]|nr:DinB family protein [Candidatus Polarisedimenticolia bacterium]